MSTTSNSPVRPAVRWLLALALGAAAIGQAPSALAATASPGERAAAVDRTELTASVELSSVQLARLDNEVYRNMAGPKFLSEAREPVVLEVRTAVPHSGVIRDSSPVIVLNGKVLENTWALLPDRLVAFLPDRTGLGADNKIEVVWVGNETATRTRAPLHLRGDQPLP
ncbi:MAG TPA: hypothetical protein PK413_11490 [Thermoanaerobaculia bacterium]|nr:hypothetical protein [Thermoanaerobaculia bacterium]